MYKVLLADDEPWVIYALKKMIDWGEYGFEIACEAEDGIVALELLRKKEVDVIFSDIRMPGQSGMDLIEVIKRENIPVKVVLISGYEEFQYAKKAIACGVFEYLLKQIKEEDLIMTLTRLKETLDQEREVRFKEDMFDKFVDHVDDKEGFVQHMQREIEYGSSRNEEVSELVKKTLAFIDQRFNKGIQLNDIAESFGVSPGYLSNTIRRETGYTFMEHITQRRIGLAKELLPDTALSVVQVAEAAGYGDYVYFTKIFKKNVGISPSKYRKLKMKNSNKK